MSVLEELTNIERKDNFMARELKRLNVNMPVDLVLRIDEYSDKMCINRSSAINVLCSLALDSQKAMNSIDDMLKLVKDEQAKKALEQNVE